jgi:hypothetical protein
MIWRDLFNLFSGREGIEAVANCGSGLSVCGEGGTAAFGRRQT